MLIGACRGSAAAAVSSRSRYLLSLEASLGVGTGATFRDAAAAYAATRSKAGGCGSRRRTFAVGSAGGSTSNDNNGSTRSADAGGTTAAASCLSVAIVGSGPSGMYTAKYLKSALLKRRQQQEGGAYEIDVIDRLPTPFGLVRSGVAPDHPEVKNVENDFAAVFANDGGGIGDGATAEATREGPVAFRGNVCVGGSAAADPSSSDSESTTSTTLTVTLTELQRMYDVVVLAYGCESDRRLNIAGEDTLRGIMSAREFVGWYNGHPDQRHLTSTLSRILNNPHGKSVAVIGQGNVALDCARILAKGSAGLASTDVASHALEVLHDGVGVVTVMGRRGHVQGAFTIKELRELTKLEEQGYGVKFEVRGDELDLGLTESSREELSGGFPMARAKGRIDKLLREAASKTKSSMEAEAEKEKEMSTEESTDVTGAGISTKQISLRFLLNPVEFKPSAADPNKLGSVLCERTRLEGEPGKQVAVGTGTYEEVPADLALVSIGYRGTPLPGLEDAFDYGRGVVRNEHGQVVDREGLYVSGWLKRGPTGIIGTNIPDAKDTVASIIRDLEAGVIQPGGGGKSSIKGKVDDSADESGGMKFRGRAGLGDIARRRGTKVIDWEAYGLIDRFEKDTARKRHEEQPREKITDVEVMLKLIE